MSEGTHDIKKEVKRYYLVFAALLILSALTVGVSYIHFGLALAITIALIIATVKSSMVAAFFMHLSHERKLIYGILIMTAFFFSSMMALFVYSYYDPIHGTEYLEKKAVPAVHTDHEEEGAPHGAGHVS